MFVFQLAQKPSEQAQQEQVSVRVFTGRDAQKIMPGVAGVIEPLLAKMHSQPIKQNDF